MHSNSDIRAAARAALRGGWGMAILVCFLLSAITGAVSYVPFLGTVAVLIIGGPLGYGVYAYFLKLVRGERPELGVMFSGFQTFGPTLVLYLLQLVFIFLWSLLLVVPGIIAALRYSMAYFILHDNPGMSGSEAIRQSKEMMRGSKGKLFLLYLSFIGWGLLCVLTLGIGFLWLAPYMQASLAAFYEQLRSASAPPSASDPAAVL